jgi:3-deoxy-D-manno-octulosonic-acid transferase
VSGAALALGWRVAASLAAPGLRMMLRRRVGRGKEWADRLPERRGIDREARPPGRLIWLHAASVGETVSAIPVIEALRAARSDVPVTVLVTTGTVSSAQLLLQRAPGVLHRFLPLDVPSWVGRFLDHWRPDAAAFVESELWPNLLLACRRRGVPLMLLNARLSDRSAAGWARVPGLARRVVGAFDAVWAQSEADAERLRALGGRDVRSPGNLKFAASPLPANAMEVARLAGRLGDTPRWLAASTHPGEEALAATVHRWLLPSHPRLVTAIAPRHPERGAALAAELGAGRRSQGDDPVPGGLWVADGLGELGLLYRLFPNVFVGKSLAGQKGGQNPLEPARFGCLLAAGPAMDNQADATAALIAAGSLTTVGDEVALATWLYNALRDPAAARQAGRAGVAVATADAELPQHAAAALLAMAG